MGAAETDRDLDSLASMDWEPPCQYTRHVGEGVATLAVWLGAFCEHTGAFRYFCDACLQTRNSGSSVYCQRCAAKSSPPTANVLRVERIREAS